ncbi:MAG TPA: cobalamin-independent methionine synthase II family protein [Candidatus Dormibacteraeota bacterium]|nr:cobalamin-independent methionine synthase II family protein [Candidatus Dormibacteraeota bacterium]
MSIPRAETVGSLLRPPELLAARGGVAAGTEVPERLRELEDAAVLDAIRLQESAGLDVITDGEMRRSGWSATTEAFDGFEARPGGPGLTWHGEGPELRQGAGYPTVVRRLTPRRKLSDEFAFLAGHSTARTKYCLPAPSYHRRFWYAEHSAGAYPTCEEFLLDVRDRLREEVARLVELGCDYVQLDAPNYGSLCDAGHRVMLEAQGHDLDAELAFDVALDSSVFEGFSGITRALHVCRGNAAGRWHSTGGYAVIAEQLFPRLAVDALLLEYDSDRAGDFAPLVCVPSGVVAVLGLLTTKTGAVEDEATIEARIAEAAAVKPLAELALSPQCGFASVAIGNPVTPAEQRAKLEVVGRAARRVWG